MNTGYRYSNVTLQYTAKDGVVWNFSPTSTSSSIVPAEFFGDSSTSPNGFRKTFDYIVPSGETARRPSSVRTSDGHRIDFTFENPPAADADYISSGTWYLKQISDENGRVVSFTRSDCVYFTIPSIGSRCSGPYRQIAVSQVDGGVLKYEYAPDANSSEPAMPKSNSFRMRRVFLPSSPTLPYLTLKYDDLSRIKSVVTPTATTSYLGSGIVGSDRAFGLTVDGLNSVSKSIIGPSAQVVAMQDALGRSTSSVYDNAGRLLRTVYAEGNAVEYSYDVRGNRLTECQIPKGRVSWATLTALTEQVPQCNVAAGDLRTTTTYMEGPTVQANLCGNPKTCNSPLSKIDAKGNQTDFTWSSVHGQILTETRPADGNGVRPVTTYGYTAYTGTDGATFYLLTSKQEKIDASNSTTTAYEYDASNHWVLKSLVTDSGGLALRTCFKFDAIGNLISKTEPRAGLASCP